MLLKSSIQHHIIITNSQSNNLQHNHIYFYQQFHNHKYIPMSSTSIYHYNFSNQYVTNSFTYIFMHIFTLSYPMTINTFQCHQHPFIITISPINISQTHSHIFSCISLHYLIITFPFTIRISCILQYQFINIYHIHNINFMQYSTSIQRHAIIRNTNLMHSSTSIHQHILTI
jgi:hypothetical protein